MDCEVCKHFEEHPFVREFSDDYCNGYDKWFKDLDSNDIFFCRYFEEGGE